MDLAYISRRESYSFVRYSLSLHRQLIAVEVNSDGSAAARNRLSRDGMTQTTADLTAQV